MFIWVLVMMAVPLVLFVLTFLFVWKQHKKQDTFPGKSDAD